MPLPLGQHQEDQDQDRDQSCNRDPARLAQESVHEARLTGGTRPVWMPGGQLGGVGDDHRWHRLRIAIFVPGVGHHYGDIGQRYRGDHQDQAHDDPMQRKADKNGPEEAGGANSHGPQIDTGA